MDKPRDDRRTDSDHNNNTRRQEFISYLDVEINNLQYSIRQPGWTKWAVSGGIAGLAWLLIYQIEAGAYSTGNVIGILLVIGLAVIFIVMTAVLMGTTDPRMEGRFQIIGYLSRNRVALLLVIGIFVFLLYANNSLSQYMATWTTVITYLLFGGLLLSSIFLFVIISLKFPVSANLRKGKSNISLIAVGIAASALAVWRYIDFLRMSPVAVNASDVRVALLIAAIVFLVSLLLETRRGSFILESLITTRRQLTLGQTNLESAIIHVDIALTGLHAHDVLEEHVSKILSLYAEASAQLQKSMQYLNDMETFYHEDQNEEAQESLGRPLLESLDKSLDRTDEIIKDIKKAFPRFKRRLFWMSTQVEISDTVNELVQKLEDATENLGQQMNSFIESFQKFRDAHGLEQLRN